MASTRRIEGMTPGASWRIPGPSGGPCGDSGMLRGAGDASSSPIEAPFCGGTRDVEWRIVPAREVDEPTYWDLADTWNPYGRGEIGRPIEGLVVLWDKSIHIEVVARGWLDVRSDRPNLVRVEDWKEPIQGMGTRSMDPTLQGQGPEQGAHPPQGL